MSIGESKMMKQTIEVMGKLCPMHGHLKVTLEMAGQEVTFEVHLNSLMEWTLNGRAIDFDVAQMDSLICALNGGEPVNLQADHWWGEAAEEALALEIQSLPLSLQRAVEEGDIDINAAWDKLGWH
tara:strand:+ start:2589 stop:2963 length:375 start_codon:yes stop_codon:yes gene_type:complete